MGKTEKSVLWVRFGDADDYNEYGDDLGAIASAMTELGIRHITKHDRYSVESDGFRGTNHISLYWGDSNAQPTWELTDDEIDTINNYLKQG